jgi:cell division septation protein DedD
VRDDDDDDDVRSGPGWLVTLFGAALLVAAGFAVGLVVGAVREEPAMWLQYVTGKSATLPAPAAAPLAPPPAPAAAPAREPREVAPPIVAPPSQAVLAPAAPSEPLPSVGSAPAAGTRFAVQVGAFSQSSEAEKLEAQLKRKGLPAYVQPSTGAPDSRWRVRIGPLASRDEADRVATKLKTQDKLPVWVLEESG